MREPRFHPLFDASPSELAADAGDENFHSYSFDYVRGTLSHTLQRALPFDPARSFAP